MRNARRCVTYAWQAYVDDDPELADRVAEAVENRKAMSLLELEKSLKNEDPVRVRATAMYLTVHGRLHADLASVRFDRRLVVRYGTPASV